MKKLSILVFLLFGLMMGINAENGNDSTKQLTETETERIVDKYSTKILNFVSTSLEKMEGPAKETFKIVVKLQIAKGIASMTPLIFMIIFFYLLYKEYNRINNILMSDNVPENMNENYGPFDESNVSVFLILYLIMAILSTAIFIFTIYNGIVHLIAPEWFAIKEIISIVK